MIDNMQKDPVCGMEVPLGSAAQSEFQGEVYRFCSENCREKFDLDPGLYIEKSRVESSSAQKE